jgi:hypothetical protein
MPKFPQGKNNRQRGLFLERMMILLIHLYIFNKFAKQDQRIFYIKYL